MGIEEIPFATIRTKEIYVWQLMIQSIIHSTIAFIIFYYISPTNVIIAWIFAVFLGMLVPAAIFWFRHL